MQNDTFLTSPFNRGFCHRDSGLTWCVYCRQARTAALLKIRRVLEGSFSSLGWHLESQCRFLVRIVSLGISLFSSPLRRCNTCRICKSNGYFLTPRSPLPKNTWTLACSTLLTSISGKQSSRPKVTVIFCENGRARAKKKRTNSIDYKAQFSSDRS